MTSIFGSKRQQAEDAAELARLMAEAVKPLSEASARKLRRIENRRAFYLARGRPVPPDPDQDAEA